MTIPSAPGIAFRKDDADGSKAANVPSPASARNRFSIPMAISMSMVPGNKGAVSDVISSLLFCLSLF